LNPGTTSEKLRGYFSSFGEVADSCVITEPVTKESRGFGFVVFEEKIPEGLFEKQHIIDQRRCGVREYSQSTFS
jgi:RNA recognition motif-containing protein